MNPEKVGHPRYLGQCLFGAVGGCFFVAGLGHNTNNLEAAAVEVTLLVFPNLPVQLLVQQLFTMSSPSSKPEDKPKEDTSAVSETAPHLEHDRSRDADVEKACCSEGEAKSEDAGGTTSSEKNPAGSADSNKGKQQTSQEAKTFGELGENDVVSSSCFTFRSA